MARGGAANSLDPDDLAPHGTSLQAPGLKRLHRSPTAVLRPKSGNAARAGEGESSARFSENLQARDRAGSHRLAAAGKSKEWGETNALGQGNGLIDWMQNARERQEPRMTLSFRPTR